MSNNTAPSSGIGFVGLLIILFIGLKLTGFIDWSWWWVLFPLWIGVAFSAVFFVLLLIYMIVVEAKGNRRDRR